MLMAIAFLISTSVNAAPIVARDLRRRLAGRQAAVDFGALEMLAGPTRSTHVTQIPYSQSCTHVGDPSTAVLTKRKPSFLVLVLSCALFWQNEFGFCECKQSGETGHAARATAVGAVASGAAIRSGPHRRIVVRGSSN
jgi:hypothetical protein